MEFRDRLIELQGTRTQKEFAEHLKIPLNTYTNWLLQSRRPTMDAIISICTKLGVSADWVLGLSDKRGGVSSAVGDAEKAQMANKIHELEIKVATLENALSLVGGRLVPSVKTGGSTATKTA